MVEIECILVPATLKASTNKAWLIKLAGEEEHWIPIAECEHYVSRGLFSIPKWLALKKGII